MLMSTELPTTEHGAVARGMGRWSAQDPTPKFGWSLDRMSDLGKWNRQTCQMCDAAQIRFVHHMRHPSGLQLEAGCICSAYMSLPVFHGSASASDIDRVIAAAEATQDGIEKAAGRVTRRPAALIKDIDTLAALRGRVHADTWLQDQKEIRKQLKSLCKRATKRFESAAVDANAYASYAGTEDEHRLFMNDANQTLEDIGDWEVALQKYDRESRLISELRSEYSWHDTDKGRTLRTSEGDMAWGGTNKKGKVSAFFQSARMEDKKWARETYDSEHAAQVAAQRALINRLVTEGRVPRKLSERAPRPVGLIERT
jgi:hypothetical protein